MQHLPNALYRLSLALIIGATVMFIVFAPVLFGIVPKHYPENGRHISGLVVSSTIHVLQWAGVACGLIASATALILSKHEPRTRRILRIGGGLLIALLSAFSALYITAHMDALREQLPGFIDSVPADHPIRIAFNKLHKLSSATHLTILLSSITLLLLPDPKKRPPQAQNL